MARFKFQATNGGYQVFYRGQRIGTIVARREASGRHCFKLGCDERRRPRTYRGKIKAAEALQCLYRLKADAAKQKWPIDTLILRAWERRPPTVENPAAG